MIPSKNVFLSYALSDKAKVRSILTQLQKHAPGRLNIANVQGQGSTKLDLRSAIQSRIAKSDEVVVLWTKDGAASSFVNYEAAMADAMDKPITVVLTDRTAPKLPWGTMAVGYDGELYIAGSGQNGGILVVKSSNAWNTIFPGWDFYSEVDMDGYLTSQVYVNPVGLLGQAYIDVDRSNGPGRGNVYVLASVVRNSNGDPADVMFSKSTDGGSTWSSPMKMSMMIPELTDINGSAQCQSPRMEGSMQCGWIHATVCPDPSYRLFITPIQWTRVKPGHPMNGCQTCLILMSAGHSKIKWETIST